MTYDYDRVIKSLTTTERSKEKCEVEKVRKAKAKQFKWRGIQIYFIIFNNVITAYADKQFFFSLRFHLLWTLPSFSLPFFLCLF